MQNNLVLCAIVAFIAWYYFAKYQDSEKEYNRLQRMYLDVCNENEKNKNRLEDLQSYKNDVSKTFQILDNELLMINDHIKNQNNSTLPTRLQSSSNRPGTSNRISILTPDLLQTLFNGMNQETSQEQEQVPSQENVVQSENVVEEEPQQLMSIDNMYNKYLINEEN
jgi:hypothetical protein